MRIAVHARGGFAVYDGNYDPHKDSAILTLRQGETRTITVEYPGPPTDVTVRTTGFTATSPTISGNKASFSVSGASARGLLDIIATVNGEVRDVRVRALLRAGLAGGSASIVSADDGSLDYGDSDDTVFVSVV